MTPGEARRRLLASSTLRRLSALLPPGRWLLTGGSLRDRLLRRASHDLDLVILGDGERGAERLARRLGGRVIPLGRPPAVTWRVIAAPYALDVWGVDGSLAKDVRRRDFTVNALAWRLPRGPLLDLVGGLDDLAAGRLQLIDPANLVDDPLRVLRGFRIAATRPELRLTASAEAALAAASPALPSIARERIHEEIRLLALGPAAARTLAVMLRLRILESLIPVAVPPGPGPPPVCDLLARLGSFRGGRAKPARELTPLPFVLSRVDELADSDPLPVAARLQTLGWPARAAEGLVRTAAAGECLIPALCSTDGLQARVLLSQMEAPARALTWATARLEAVGGSPVVDPSDLFRWWGRFSRRPPLLNGDEVADLLGLPPGPDRAAALAELRAARASGYVVTRAQARRWLQDRPRGH